MLIAWGAKLTEAELARLLEVAAEIGCDPSHLSACIEFESRWNPTAVNAATLATGLIQFMPSTAAVLGVTIANLHGMSRLQQLDYVLRYLKPFAGRLRTLSDCYMAILWPRAVGKPEGYVVFADGSAAYVANAALDVDHDGQVTKAECAAFVERRLADGLLPENAALVEQAGAGDAQAATMSQPMSEPADAPTAQPAQPAGPFDPEQEPSMSNLADTVADAAPAVGSIFGPAGTLIGSLAGVLIKAFSPLAQEKIAKEVNRHTDNPQVGDAVATAVVTAAQQLTGNADPIAATVEAVNNPAIVAQVQAAALTKLDELAPFLDRIAAYEQAQSDRGEASMNAAAARQAASPQSQAIAVMLARSSVAMMVGVVTLLASALAAQVYLADTHAPDATLMTLLAGAVGAVIANFGQLFNFQFGSTPTSKAKDEAIAELAARRPRVQ